MHDNCMVIVKDMQVVEVNPVCGQLLLAISIFAEEMVASYPVGIHLNIIT